MFLTIIKFFYIYVQWQQSLLILLNLHILNSTVYILQSAETPTTQQIKQERETGRGFCSFNVKC